jgi:hypothetical protein
VLLKSLVFGSNLPTLTYGGSLTVRDLGPDTLTAGDSFKLFSTSNDHYSGNNYSGAFASIELPPLGPGLDWTNRLLVDGSIAVVEQAWSPELLIQYLIALVNESDLPHKRPLLATLEAALSSVQRGHSISAANQLHAFQNKVRAHVHPDDPDFAMELIDIASQAIDALEDDGLPDAQPLPFYNFDDGTLQGWSNVRTSSIAGGPYQFTAQDPPNEGVITGHPNPLSGGFMAAPDPFDSPGLGGTRDFPHQTLLLRSPQFMLEGAGGGDLSVFLIGGTGDSSTPAVSVNSSLDGFLGVGLRRVSDGQYVLSGRRTRNGQWPPDWEQIVWTESQLVPLGTSELFTLDLLDTFHGDWGWIAMDDVSIPGLLAPRPNTAEAVEHLIRLVNESDLHHKRPLLASLEAALASIQRGSCHSAEGQLGAFRNKVDAQVTDTALATELSDAAEQVITALDCDGSSQLAGRIHSLKRHPNGKMQMKIKGEAGKSYILEASTNLVDWEAICVVQPDEEGDCGYEDFVSDKHPCRFYRLNSP